MGEAVGRARVMAVGIRSRLQTRALVLVACASMALSPMLAGCKRHPTVNADDAPTATFTVTEASEGLLLTWIDERGDFHVEQKVSDVPLVGRDAVRVVDPTREEGTHSDKVFVADLRSARSDGTFALRAMTRAEFDAFAVTRRTKTTPALASAGPALPPANAPIDLQDPHSQDPHAQDPRAGNDPNIAARPAVIIYGATWCGACHDAEAYMKRKGIPYVEKDIEADAKAAAEMRGKLSRAGLRSGSIPVLDVRGRVMVGFNPREVDNALGQAL